MKQSFIIKYDGDLENSCFSIDCDIDGYQRLNNDAPIINIIKETDVGSTNYFGDIKFELVYKSADLVCTRMDNNRIKESIIFNYRQTLRKRLTNYNSIGFLHTTSLENLYSIYKKGFLYSRDMIQKIEAEHIDIANHNVLDITDDFYFKCVRFYLRKNTPANYRFQGKNCILVCSYDILYSNYDMYITEKIATAKPYVNSLDNTGNLNYLINEFRFEKVYNEKYSEFYKDFKGAEFLVRNSVSLEYIDKIIFENDSDKKWFIESFPDWKIEIIVDKNYFKKSLEVILDDKIF